ncbi:MAG: glycosyltransferase family 1 protein [Candidatus Omnitrophica bacterium]|nr:glycosyltransferase family 1 protein [Candidatus Omnitrophota bacterium]
MQVLVDVSVLAFPEKTGIAHYVTKVLPGLLNSDVANRYLLFGSSFRNAGRLREELRDKFPGAQGIVRMIPDKVLDYGLKYALPLETLAGKEFDLAYLPGPSLYFTRRAKKVAVIHDVALKRNPDWNKFLYTRSVLFQLQKFLAGIDAIIVDADATKKDLQELYGIPAAKITVIPLAVDHDQFRPVPDSQISPEIDQITGGADYILFVSTLEPRKNIPNILRAFSQLKKTGLKEKLVLVGRKGWLCNEIFRTWEELNLKNEVIFAGYAGNALLPHFYSRARFLIFPSLYEGFGLPILEAMACGCPIITSSVSSMPEVAGDAALLVNPYAVEEIAEAMGRLLKDNGLRENLRRKGMERVKLFSWENTARETLKVFEKICAQN